MTFSSFLQFRFHCFFYLYRCNLIFADTDNIQKYDKLTFTSLKYVMSMNKLEALCTLENMYIKDFIKIKPICIFNTNSSYQSISVRDDCMSSL